MITSNEVYSRISASLRAKFEGILTTSTRVYAPKVFPCVWIVEIDATPDGRYINLDLSDDQRRSTFEVQAYSNKPDTAMLEVSDIIDETVKAFRKLGYVCTMVQPMDNGYDENIKRKVARFTRLIGGGDTLPEEQ